MAYTKLPDDSPLRQAGARWTREDLVLYLLDNIEALHGLLSTGTPNQGFPTNAVIIGSEGGGLTGLELVHGDLIVGQGTLRDRKAPIALPVGNAGQILELVLSDGFQTPHYVDPNFNTKIGTILTYGKLRR